MERQGTCELCGKTVRPWPRTGKKRYAHKCPHGTWCVRGDHLLGWHANWPRCKECLPFARQWYEEHSQHRELYEARRKANEETKQG